MRSLKYLLSLGICLLAISACTSSSKTEGIHPDPDRLPADEEVDHFVDLQTDDASYLPELYNPQNLDHIAPLGVDDQVDREHFEPPNKLDIDPDGNIYVVHEQTNTIHVYGREGTFSHKLGGRGQGPGEFQQIITFDFSSDYEKLYVLDWFEVEIFERVDNQYEPAKTIQTNLARTFDLCVLNSEIFISGYGLAEGLLDSLRNTGGSLEDIRHVSGPILTFDTNSGEQVNSFGYQYNSYSGIGPFDGLLSETKLSCNEHTDTVVGQLIYYPFMFGYTPDGKVKWTSKIENFVSTQATESTTSEGRPSLSFYTNKDIFNRFNPFRETHNEYALIQIVYSSPQPHNAKSDTIKADKSKYHTLLVDTNTGELSVSDSYAKLGLVKNSTVLTMDVNYDSFLHEIQINELE